MCNPFCYRDQRLSGTTVSFAKRQAKQQQPFMLVAHEWCSQNDIERNEIGMPLKVSAKA